MSVMKKILISLPDSPYRILDAPFDADSRAVNAAMRVLFKKDPVMGGRQGNQAQKKLTDPRERVKTDAYCCEVEVSDLNLAGLAKHLETDSDDVYCRALQNPIILSDLFFSEEINLNVEIDLDFGELTYREQDGKQGK